MKDRNSFQKLAPRTRSGRLIALLLLAGLSALVTPLRADNPPTYAFQWGSNGSGTGQFSDPVGIVIDQNNNVYVADQINDRIEKFGSNGTYLTQWGSLGTSNGQFEYPWGVATDSSNDVYVVQDSASPVEKFDSNGNYLAQFGGYGTDGGQFVDPLGIAIDSGGNVYVADTQNNRVDKFGSGGNYLGEWGGYGTGSGQFETPQAIAIDSSNNVYVADTGNNRIEKFNTVGTYLTQWGSGGTGNGQFEGPIGIAVDGSHNVYVTDFSNNRIEKFNGNGNYLTQWGSVGSGNGQFEQPVGIAVTGDGNIIYVVDEDNSRIQVFINNLNVTPYINSQPASQNIQVGGNVTFSVGVLNTVLAYQWMSNNIALPNATNSALTLTNVTFSDSASYAVLVTNSFGSTLSSDAVLTVVPAMVTTLPATGITASNAVLNGSATVGPDETIVWFDWGTDTNYGNVVGTTVVPGNGESTNLSITLALAGGVYRYRLNAANDFGIAYGNDQSFTVGLAPTATTLSPVNTVNGMTLDALINPEGLDTTVYFKWGLEGNRTNTTAGVDVGSGTTPVNVGSLITGLAQDMNYSVQVVASNHLGTVSGITVNFETPPPYYSVPGENWDSVASSADGRVLVMVANETTPSAPSGGPIYISTNSGVTWTPAGNAPVGFWETVACSADGSKIIAAGGGGLSFVFSIYTSSDTGATWVSNNVPAQNWQAVASSADGTKLVAADYADRVIYTSTNSGATWTQATNAPVENWYSIASSADGSKLAAVATARYVSDPGATNIYTSTNFGATWITNPVPPGPNRLLQNSWFSIASSADGNKLVAAGGGNGGSGYVFVSTNSGSTWRVTATNATIVAFSPWQSVAISADGSKLAAVAETIGPFAFITSTNSGATWAVSPRPSIIPVGGGIPYPNAVALSADGAQEVVSFGYPSTSAYVYVTQSNVAPALRLAPLNGQFTLSWIIPSLDFNLQQSPDLSSWTDMTNLPVLNLTNLENQVVLPTAGGSSFFRLKSN